MQVDPNAVYQRYKGLNAIIDAELTNTVAARFGALSRISHEAASTRDPLAGAFFLWTDPQTGHLLEVVGQLDDAFSIVLYRPHPMFNSKQAHLDARVDLIRAFLTLRGVDVSHADGLLIHSPARGRALWTGEFLTIELLDAVGALIEYKRAA